MREKVEAVLAKIRPMLEADGGGIELVDVSEGGIVKVRLKGACQGCMGAQMTLKMGVERALKEEIPEIVEVRAV
ncbi:MAG: NifU family protein [Desulfobacterota bacterium]|nr:NifU family protein [Thermodesulfobacteriota bacterium]